MPLVGLKLGQPGEQKYVMFEKHDSVDFLVIVEAGRVEGTRTARKDYREKSCIVFAP